MRLGISIARWGHNIIRTLDVPVGLDADVHKLKTQARNSSNTAADANQSHIAARSIPGGYVDWPARQVIAHFQFAVHEALSPSRLRAPACYF